MPRMETTTEVEVEVDFEVWCGTCGKGLCQSTEVNDENIEVDACPDCINEAKQEERDDAYSDGHEDGWDEGYKQGYEKARQELREEQLFSGLGPSGEKVCKPLCMSR